MPFVPAELNDLSVDVSLASVVRGDILRRGASKWQNLAVGTAGQVLTVTDIGAGVLEPRWAAASGGVTDHGALTGLADDDHALYALADKSRPATWVAAGDLTARSVNDLGTKTHALLTSLAADDHTQYTLLAGRSSGQTLSGGTGSGENLQLHSTAHATKGKILLGSLGAYDGVTGFVGVGTQSPAARLHTAGNISAAAWGLNGINLRAATAIYTDTSSSGTVTNAMANAFARPTFAASSATVFSNAATVYIADAPLASTNVTQTRPYALFVDAGDVRFDGNACVETCLQISTAGTFTAPANGQITIPAGRSQAAWGTFGAGIRMVTPIYNDTTSSGTVASAAAHGFGTPTFTATGTVTFTDAANVYIGNAPTAGTNVTETRNWALWVDAGNCRLDGNVLIGGTAKDAAAALQIDSTTQGVLLPRMTTTQRDAIGTPPAGLLIYNTTTGKLNVRVAAAWEAVTSS